MIRFAYTLILVLAAFLLPWWLWLVFGALGALVFRNFYELLPVALWADSLYGLPEATAFRLPYFFLIIALGIVIFSEPLKKDIAILSKIPKHV